MCGIMGYVGHQEAGPILMDGLRRLEYRGYDSAGIAVVGPEGGLTVSKAAGKLSALVSLMNGGFPPGSIGIGHTRWATHGRPSDVNAHPHLDCRGEVVVIHNGIVENYLDLKKELAASGHSFVSQTDTEVIPHLIESYLAQGVGLEEASRRAFGHLEGSQAITVLSTLEPEKIVAARIGYAGGLVIGYGQDEMFVASDLPALLPHTQRVAFLYSGEMAVITAEGASYWSLDGSPMQKSPQHVPYDPVSAAKGGHKHFMFKEIMEQPEAIMDTMRGRLEFEPPAVRLENLPFSKAELGEIKRVAIVACGTSLHAALVGKFMIEQLARIPVEVDYGSEFRYRDPLVGAETLLVAISQSGETVDTLAAMEEARRKGVRQLAICNVMGSQATQLADGVIYTRAGLEVGVAASKTFIAQLTALYLLGVYMGRVRGKIDNARMKELVEDLVHLPHLVGQVLERNSLYEALAHRYFRHHNFLYLGRGINYPIALEGALKLKELSYIHAEGYPAGEMKHGPIALIDENMPVVAIASRDRVYEKMRANIEEVKARDGVVIALATEGDLDIAQHADDVIYVPAVSPLLSPLLNTVPLQLLAYHIAVRRGCDVDQPRNLAKSVTVE